jgi:hypothetical protein
VVAGLFRGKARNGREDTESIASEHDDVGGLAIDDAGDLSVGDEFNRVGTAGVFCDADVFIVGTAGSGTVDNVLEDGTELDGIVDIRLLLSREVDALGVAATLDIEDTSV